MEAKYFKDYKYNYLMLKWEGTEGEKSYQQKMLASNKIDRILKCSVRHINGTAYYYYDISSKVSLENLYQGKKMSYEQVKDFLEQMDCIYGKLAQYFMEEAGLLTQPEYIYYDISSRQYYGLYYPQVSKERNAEEMEENLYEPLLDFLLNHIDTENQKLVDNMYRIYELSEEQFFSLADALAFFEETEESRSDIPAVGQPPMEPYKIEPPKSQQYGISQRSMPPQYGMPQQSTPQYGMPQQSIPRQHGMEQKQIQPTPNQNLKQNIRPYIEETDGEVSADRSLETDKKSSSPQKKNQVYYGIFAVLSMCGLFGEIWIYWAYQLTRQELLLLSGCAVITFLCFGFSLVQCLLSGRRRARQEKEDALLQQDIEDEFRDLHPVSLEGIVTYDMDSAIIQDFNREEVCRDRRNKELQKEPQNFGETIFIDLKQQGMEHKLYALDRKNKKHIELTKFPFTIGKMGGLVDCAIEDDSISRLHARIEKQENKILLTDMNSTNGTYKNGLRMEPSETVEIEPGDEIRFGKVNYCYR